MLLYFIVSLQLLFSPMRDCWLILGMFPSAGKRIYSTINWAHMRHPKLIRITHQDGKITLFSMLTRKDSRFFLNYADLVISCQGWQSNQVRPWGRVLRDPKYSSRGRLDGNVPKGTVSSSGVYGIIWYRVTRRGPVELEICESWL